MSKNVKAKTSKNINQKTKLDNLLTSYKTLKIILSPNLNEKNNLFMNSIIDLIISQVKLLFNLLNLNDAQKIFDLLNINSQNLSKQISSLYEFQNFSFKNSKDSLLTEKGKNNNIQLYLNNKENNILEDQKQVNIIDLANSANFDSTENQNENEPKYIEKENYDRK